MHLGYQELIIVTCVIREEHLGLIYIVSKHKNEIS